MKYTERFWEARINFAGEELAAKRGKSSYRRTGCRGSVGLLLVRGFSDRVEECRLAVPPRESQVHGFAERSRVWKLVNGGWEIFKLLPLG